MNKRSLKMSKKKIFFLAALAMFVSFIVFAGQNKPDAYKTLSAEELLEKIKPGAGKNFVLIDCRPEDEYRAGHIPGALNISMDSLAFGKDTVLKSAMEQILKEAARIIDFILIDSVSGKEYMPQSKLEELLRTLPEDRYQEIIFYCRRMECTRSPMAIRWTLTLGYKNVWRYEGGWEEWAAKKLPVETDTE
jgi:ArsR family transcriptional regulator